ncbi:MAG: hypothetical protein CMJ43_03260, partial [Phyllobacteriaceae bacterium]|nr:hypothetical protein [Phyllobacteriaceae bacterium]
QVTKWKAQEISTGVWDFPSMYKLCIHFDDPNWPSVLDSSGEFIPMTTRVNYEIQCHDVDQNMAFDMTDDAECDTADGPGSVVFGDSSARSHHCPKLGGVKRPCDPAIAANLWDLVICDKAGENAGCIAATDMQVTRKDLPVRYGGNSSNPQTPKWGNDVLGVGTTYVFEHDNTDTSNPFSCRNKQLDNIRLRKHGYMRGDATEAQNSYICADGGRSSECASDKGEMVHSLDTCYDDSETDNLPGSGKGVVSGIARKVYCTADECFQDNANDRTDCSGSTAQANTNCNAYTQPLKFCKAATTNPAAIAKCFWRSGTDRVDCSDQTNNNKVECDPDQGSPYEAVASVKSIEAELLEYDRKCDKELRVRVNKGVTGQLMLRLVVKVYSSQIDETNPWKGYVSQRSTLIPVAIEAVVKESTKGGAGADMPNAGYAGNHGEDIYEWGAIDAPGFNSVTGSMQIFPSNPFTNMKVHDNGRAMISKSDMDYHVARYSRSTRTYIEFIDCTNSSLFAIAAELDRSVPRYRITSSTPALADEEFYGDFTYVQDCFDEGVNRTDKNCRMFQMKHPRGSDQTIAMLQMANYTVHFRSYNDRTEADAGQLYWSNFSNAANYGNFHESYPGMIQKEGGNPGLCWQTRLHVYEPSSCSLNTITSDKYYTRVKPRNTLSIDSGVEPTVDIKQAKKIFLEDEMFPLDIEVKHPQLDKDSEHFYFSHIEICDDFSEDSGDFAETAHNGTGFDLFSYGNTRGDRSANFYTDAILNGGAESGITKLQNKIGGKTCWRSFANDCTRFIYEQWQKKGQSGSNAPIAGGFMMGNSLQKGGFSTAEECLIDARGGASYDAKHIWGGTMTSNQKRRGVWFRPPRKDTRNFRMTVKLFTFDGDPAVWNKDATWQEAEVTRTFASIPKSTRYDQDEISQSMGIDPGFVVNENGQGTFPLSVNFPSMEGLYVPLPLRKEVQLTSNSKVDVGLCTYTNEAAASIDAYEHTDLDDHDRLCNPDASCDLNASPAKCFEYTQNNVLKSKTGCKVESGYRVSCVKTANAKRAGRMEIAAIVLFDESEAHKSCANCNNAYLDGSAEWGGDEMDMPEQQDYQPAGNNLVASDFQWYRIEPSSTDDIDRVGWCDNETATLKYTVGTSDTVVELKDDTSKSCDISELGQAASTVNSNGLGVAYTAENLLNSFQPSDDSSKPKGYMKNFWIVYPKSNSQPLPSTALKVQGLSHFNTERGATRAPVGVRVIAVSRDVLQLHEDVVAGGETATALSKSDTNQGAQDITFQSVIDLYTPIINESAWGRTATIDGKEQWIAYVEEKNVAGDHTDAIRTWQERAALPGNEQLSLEENIDCQTNTDFGPLPESSTICLDRLRYKETTDFHDQHSGLVKLEVHYRKTCGPQAKEAWIDAGGLFDVSLRVEDDYPYVGSPAPGNGTFKVSDSWKQRLRCNAEGKECGLEVCPTAFDNKAINAGQACMVVKQGEKVSQTSSSQTVTVVEPFASMSPTGAGYPRDMNTTWINSDYTTGFKSRGYGQQYSLCVKTLFDQENNADDDNEEHIRGTWCTYASSMNELHGRNTLTWFNLQTTRPLENHCPKLWNDKQSTSLSDNFLSCPRTQTGTLARFMERIIAMNARMELPEKWCNCLTFRTSVTISNDDRQGNAPHGRELSFGTGSNLIYATPNNEAIANMVALYTEPQCVAEVPELYFEPNLQRDRHCVGRSNNWLHKQSASNQAHFNASCGEEEYEKPYGVKAHNGIKIKNNEDYTGGESNKYISDWNDASQTELMELRNQGKKGSFDAQKTMVAGYATQFLFSGFSSATDDIDEAHIPYGETVYNTSEEASYRWDKKGRGTNKASGEVTFLTIESKFEKLTGLSESARQYFCVYRCPSNNPNCAKHELVRELPVPETNITTGAHQTGQEHLSDWEKYNVNMDRCPDDWSIAERKEKCDANGFKKGDNYGRQPNLPFECPSYDPLNPNAPDRPGSRYSLKATAADGVSSVSGHNPEWGNIYIVYPKESSSDDLLEFKLWSRSDWRANGAGFQYSAMTVYIKMRPSITLSTVSIASKFEVQNNICKHGAKWCCDVSNPDTPCQFGAFGRPLQPKLDAAYSNSARNQTTQVSIYESQFSGTASCKSIVNSRVDNATSDSRRQQLLHCGIGVPLRFDDPSLRGVIPTSVRVSIETMAPFGSVWAPKRCPSTAAELAQDNTYPDCLMDDNYGLYPKELWDNKANRNKRIRAMLPSEMAQGIIMPCRNDQQPGGDATKCAEDFLNIARTTNTQNNRLEAVTQNWITANNVNADTMTLTATTLEVPVASSSAGLVNWAIGEKMDRKRVWLTGRSLGQGETHTKGSYRFDNKICEPDRVFRVKMKEAEGFNEASISQAYNTLSVTVRDDDRYGRFNLCTKQSVQINGTTATRAWPITSDVQLLQDDKKLGDQNTKDIQINDWKAGSQELKFWVEHARHKSDSVIDTERASELAASYYSSSGQEHTGWEIVKEPILPSRMCVKITVGESMKPSDWVVSHDFVEGNGDEEATAQGTQRTGAEVIANQNLYCIDFSGCKPREDGDNCAEAWDGIPDDPNPRESRNVCTCAGTMPTTEFGDDVRPTQDLGFRWVLIKINGVQSVSDSACQFDSDQTVSVKLDSVYYPNDPAWGDFKGNKIEVNSAACPQNILPHEDVTISWILKANKTASNIQKQNPWKIAFQGLDPNIEKDYDAPLSWMGNLKATQPDNVDPKNSPLYKNGADGTYMTFTETEHSKCGYNQEGLLSCDRREIRMHLCLQDRKAEADVLPADSQYTWGDSWSTGAQKMSFWVDVQDADAAYAKVHKFYELKCPAKEYDASTQAFKDPLRTAGFRAPGTILQENYCAAYSRMTYEYVAPGGNGTRHKPVPCNDITDNGWRISDVCNDACETPQYCNNGQPPVPGVTKNSQTGQLYECLSEANRTQFCEADASKPYRLYFEFSIAATDSNPNDAFTCLSVSDATSTADDNKHKNLPYFSYTTVEDGEVNLSRRPQLIIGSPSNANEDTAALSMLRASDKPADASCTVRATGGDATGSKVQLRITDDSVFTANNAKDERDISVFEAESGNLEWNSNDGFLEIKTTDRYFDADNEKTLINVGIGACPSPTELNGLWNTENGANPFAKAPGTDGSAFGDCDSFEPTADMMANGVTKKHSL